MTLNSHPIFEYFQPFQGEVPVGFDYDFIGSFTDFTFYGVAPSIVERRVEAAPVPSIDEEYFEWIDLLTSVRKASGSYTVVEIGAGWGRWAVRAVLAARKKGLTVNDAVLVEAEPVHASWARKHLETNQVKGHVLEAAAGRNRGKLSFAVRPPEAEAPNPANWYGQALLSGEAVPTSESYNGHRLDRLGDWGTIEVNVMPLTEILEGVDHVDFLDMDIQGAEADVVTGGLDILDAKVSMLHIGTHSTEVEETIRSALTMRGWVAEWDFPVASVTSTPFGKVSFQDGVQSWRNPLY